MGFFCRLQIFFKINFFEKLFQEYHQCQTAWIQIRPNILLGLIWVQTLVILHTCKCSYLVRLGKNILAQTFNYIPTLRAQTVKTCYTGTKQLAPIFMRDIFKLIIWTIGLYVMIILLLLANNVVSSCDKSMYSKCSSISLVCLSPFCGTKANSADPDQTPQNAASDQGPHCLLTDVQFRFE